MNCPYYKVYILDGSKFCAWCGRKIFLSDEKLHNQTVKPATKVEGKTFGVIIGLVMFLLFGVSLCNERMNGWLQDYKEEDVQDALSRNRK